MVFDPADALALLCQPLNKTSNPHAKAIALYQFQTWVYFPDDPKAVERAGQMIAAKASHEYRSFLKEEYPEEAEEMLVDEVLFSQHLDGELGLTALLYCPSPAEFRNKVDERHDASETACDMFEFMCRQRVAYPDTKVSTRRAYTFRGMPIHDDLEKQREATKFGNKNFQLREITKTAIGRGDKSRKTMSDRWTTFKESIPFLFLSRQFGIDLKPQRIPEESGIGFVFGPLTDRASNPKPFVQLCGKYLYLKKLFEGHSRTLEFLELRGTTGMVEVPVAPFTPDEIKIFERYADEADYMSDL